MALPKLSWVNVISCPACEVWVEVLPSKVTCDQGGRVWSHVTSKVARGKFSRSSSRATCASRSPRTRFALASHSLRFHLCSPKRRKKLRLFCSLLARRSPHYHTARMSDMNMKDHDDKVRLGMNWTLSRKPKMQKRRTNVDTTALNLATKNIYNRGHIKTKRKIAPNYFSFPKFVTMFQTQKWLLFITISPRSQNIS